MSYHASALVAPATILRTTASERWRELIAQQFIPGTVAADGLRIDLGDGAQLLVLQSGDDTTAMTLRLNYGHFSVHFDGGAVSSTSLALATVLRAAGHGNADPVTPQLLDALTPSFVVFSLGGTRVTTLNADMLSQLDDMGAAVYRTDANGTITFTSDGERVWVETERSLPPQTTQL